jgi:hypothetical protein
MLPVHSMPLHGLIGGLMIGSAAAIMLLGLGRIAGVSGLAARAVGLASGPPGRSRRASSSACRSAPGWSS